MSDTPGWASPGSPPPERGPEDSARPPAPQGWNAAPPPSPGQPPQQPGPQQGWGQQQPGWGGPQQPGNWGGWHPHTFAAKPGVIPLRPLGIGEILDGAVSTARAHWRTVLAIALGIAVITQLISTVAMRTWLSDSSGLAALEDNPNPTDEEIRDAFTDLGAFASVTGVITILGSVLATAMLTIVVSRAVLGREVTFAEAWQDSRSRLLRLLGVVLLVPLIAVLAVAVPTLLGALTGNGGAVALGVIGGIVLAIWLWVRFSLAAPALMLERQGVIAALRRSAKLVRGSWWRVFGVQLLVLVLLTVVAGIIEFPTSAIAGIVSGDGANSFFEGSFSDMSWTYLAISGIGAVIASTITLPVSAGVTALLYIDQRIRREALDIELARAAGVGTPPRES
ncbi:DUF7544 domain-containing protein [Streptomyces litchfieldiae]|uniref:Glycerophosphoryl diester phosphodiesterase membrane domain-containing protein n=1 Tax=Streptomyces litchfieldiae TaxID=3075543 RepID=A0ABU2MN57_9ACTN|nr:hypothetical protein [Streptomyces sp. DSM 44938]MDT0343046.1 hypothetical protein [Streptomyces sp. DSM 44938]